MRIGFTGHRPADLGPYPDVLPRLLPVACEMIAGRWPAAVWLCGGASGVDEAVATQAIRLAVPFELHLPFPPEVMHRVGYIDEASYGVLKAQVPRAACVRLLYPDFDPRAYQARNRSLVEHADLVIAFWNCQRRGGTYQTVSYAWQRGVVVLNALRGQLEPLPPPDS